MDVKYMKNIFVKLFVCTGVLFMVVNSYSEQIIKAKPLKRGDTIAIVAPSYPLKEEAVKRLVRRLESRGFKVKQMPNIFSREGYLAGTDEERVKNFMDAWLDPEVKAIFPGTGGYGLTRILDKLDWNAIRDNPKILAGFSDVTALHLAIMKKCGLVTFHAPNTMYSIGSKNGMNSFSKKYFWGALLEDDYYMNNGQRLAPGWTYNYDALTSPPQMISGGCAKGRLTGGNLSLISALSGTPYEMETEGRIVFIEDVGERPYRIDRMLSQLRLAGKLDNAAGFIIGRFNDCEDPNPEKSFSTEEIFNQYFKNRPYPVIYNFPVGHVSKNATIPVGCMAELDADNLTLKILEDPVLLKDSKSSKEE
jgi:muramoyltetrapeptide carboxypeptidase